MASKAGAMFADLGQILAPPNRIPVCDAADDVMKLADGGDFTSELTPYMIEPTNLLTSRDHHTIVYVAPARTGKSLCLIAGGVAYIITSNPADTKIVHMTEKAARGYSRQTMNRIIKNSPELAELQSPSRDDDNVLAKYFRNGMALNIGYPSPTELSAADYKYMFMSDFDRYGDNAEGDTYIQAKKRTQTFMSAGMTVVESSPGKDFTESKWDKKGKHEAPPVGGILGLYNQGDRRIQYWICPHCGDAIMLYPGLDLFQLPNTEKIISLVHDHGAVKAAEKYSTIWCPHCGSQITQKHKREMNRTGFWQKEHDKPSRGIASFWGSGYSAVFQTWQSIIENEFSALHHLDLTGEEQTLKTTRNVDQGVPYVPQSILSKMSAEWLEDRAEDYPQGEVMPGVLFLTAEIDVQIHKFVVQVMGVGMRDERWVIDRFDLKLSNRPVEPGSKTMDMISPASYEEDWDVLLDAVITKSYPLYGDDEERRMNVLVTGCDSHGADGVTDNAYKFWKKCKDGGLKHRFVLLRGERPSPKSNQPFVLKTILDKNSKSARKAKTAGTQEVWRVNTTHGKDTVMARLRREVVGAGYYHFAKWLPSSFYSEIVAETRGKMGWEQGRSNNETFDLLDYDLAVLKVKMLTQYKRDINWDALPPWAEPWDTNSEVFSPADREANVETKPAVKATRDVRARTKRQF